MNDYLHVYVMNVFNAGNVIIQVAVAGFIRTQTYMTFSYYLKIT